LNYLSILSILSMNIVCCFFQHVSGIMWQSRLRQVH